MSRKATSCGWRARAVRSIAGAVARARFLGGAVANGLRPSSACAAAGAKHALVDRDAEAHARLSWEEAVHGCWAGDFAETADGWLAALDPLLGARAVSSNLNYGSKARIFFECCGVNLEGGMLSRSVEVPVVATSRPPENFVCKGGAWVRLPPPPSALVERCCPRWAAEWRTARFSRNLYIDPSCLRSEAANAFFGYFVQDESPGDIGAYQSKSEMNQ